MTGQRGQERAGGSREDATRWLNLAAAGDARATDELIAVVYDELHRIATALVARDRPNAERTLQPTALVHEAYLRLIGPDVAWQNRAHFFGAAARAMRRILIDRARSARSARDGRIADDQLPAEVTIAGDGSASIRDDEELLALDEALESLRQRDERQHEVVMLRYFAGLTIEQTAEVLSVSPATVKNEWTYARAWLLRAIEPARKKSP